MLAPAAAPLEPREIFGVKTQTNKSIENENSIPFP